MATHGRRWLASETAWTALTRSLVMIALLAICAYMARSAPRFFRPDNLMVILRSVAEKGVIAFGMTMVIIAGEIDLSVSSMAALSGCLTAWLIQAGAPLPLAISVALLVGAFGGVVTGAMRCWFRVPTFITTLALLKALRGAALLVCGEFTLTPFSAEYAFLGNGYVVGVPFPAIVFLVVFVAIHFVMTYTTFGRQVYAVGGNAEAARLSGVNVSVVRMSVLAITGLLAAASGLMISSRLMAGNPNVAEGWELDVIAAVIIGGTSLSGGAGSVWGTLLGIIFVGVIGNAMIHLDIRPCVQHIVLGGIILLAVLANQVQRFRSQ